MSESLKIKRLSIDGYEEISYEEKGCVDDVKKIIFIAVICPVIVLLVKKLFGL